MDTWSIQNINEKDTQLRRSNLMVSSDFQGSGVEALIKKKTYPHVPNDIYPPRGRTGHISGGQFGTMNQKS